MRSHILRPPPAVLDSSARPPGAARRAAHILVAAITGCGLLLTAPVFSSAANAQSETQLSETGWTASSNTDYSASDAPQNAISGDTGARFSSDADQASGLYFQVNMGSAESFNQIEMDSGGYSGDYARGYNVEVSSDGSTFTTVYSGTGTSSPETATFTTHTAQYIRVVLTASSSTNWWSIVNFTVYSSSSSGGGGSSGQLSETGWTASSNTNSPSGDAPQNAIGGTGGPRFSSDADQAPGMWWQVNMGSQQTFNQVELNSGSYTGDYANGYDVEVSNDGSKFTPVYAGTGTSSPDTATFSPQTAQYIRILLTASSTTNWWSMTSFTASNTPVTPPTAPAPATGGSLGSNVYVFSPSDSVSSILSTLNTISNAQVSNQFGTARQEILFEPGTYGSSSDPLVFTVGYYESIAGLGQNPSDVVINGAINSYNQCTNGDQSECYATDNFWRSISNLTINVSGMTGCFNDTDVWAVSQASPLRDVDVTGGNLTLMDYCDGSPDYASGGFIADSVFSGGVVTNGSQQQYFVRNSDIDSWSNGVWNQVFCGDPGAPAQSFSSDSGDSGGTEPYTTLASCPVTEEEPYLYVNSSGSYNVFVPSPQTNSSGPTWSASSNTPGTSLSLSTFYVVNSSSSVAQINAALAAGDNLLFTPGVYSYGSTINVTNPNTKIIGLGFATLIPTSGNITMNVADVPGVNISGLIFDAGPSQSSSLLQIGTEGSSANNAANPVSVDDVFFRVGGAEAGTVATAFVDNSNNSVIDDVWVWRADHGAGAGSWTSDQSATGLVVNGNDVTANGLAVEHFQQYETIWNGQGGTDLFFQNENPYEVPSQSVWMSSATQDGYPAFYIPPSVTSFTGYGMGSYSYFDQGVNIENAMAFQSPDTAGVTFHDILTVFLSGSGGIESVINETGAAVDSSFGGPADVVTYP